MKISVALILASIGSAIAFAPTSVCRPSRLLFMSDEAAEEEEAPAPAPVAPTSKCMSKAEILSEPNTIEFQQMWDPFKLSELGSDETVAWFRHSEVKHGRVAMAAFVGWWVVAAGYTFPGDLSTGVPFASLPTEGLAAWDAVPGWGKVQMLLFAGLIEFHDELFFSRRSTHYMKGGTPGKVNFLSNRVLLYGLMFSRSHDVEFRPPKLAEHGSWTVRPLWTLQKQDRRSQETRPLR